MKTSLREHPAQTSAWEGGEVEWLFVPPPGRTSYKELRRKYIALIRNSVRLYTGRLHYVFEVNNCWHETNKIYEGYEYLVKVSTMKCRRICDIANCFWPGGRWEKKRRQGLQIGDRRPRPPPLQTEINVILPKIFFYSSGIKGGFLMRR